MHLQKNLAGQKKAYLNTQLNKLTIIERNFTGIVENYAGRIKLTFRFWYFGVQNLFWTTALPR